MSLALIKRILYISLPLAAVFFACKKGPGVTTRLMVHNASFETASLGAVWSGTSVTPTALAQGGTSGTPAEPYVSLPAGTNNMVLKSGATVILDKNLYGAPGGAFTLLVYDSSKATNSLATVLLTDPLSVPDSGFSKLRFINCVPDTAVNMALVSTADTIYLTSVSFIGAYPTVANIQAFNSEKPGKYKPYILRAGDSSLTSPLLTADSITMNALQVYSIIYSGLRSGTGAQALKLAFITHPLVQ